MREPDYRAEPKASPEGDAIATARHSAWSSTELDPIVDPEPAERGYGSDRLAEAARDAMAARAIRESELIGFWLAWHRAGGFAQLERGGWDRSTIFRRIRRFRSYFGVHPDDARFPWLTVDWPRVWSGDRLVALEWAQERGPDAEPEPGDEPQWRPTWAHRSDPHALEPEDPFKGPAKDVRPWVVDGPEQAHSAPDSE